MCNSITLFSSFTRIVFAIALPITDKTESDKGKAASGTLASPIPINCGLLAANIPPSLYQLTSNFGTCGGTKLNFPVKLKRGNFGIVILGILSFNPVKKPLILSIIPLILSLADSIGFNIAFLASLNLFLTFVYTSFTFLPTPVTISVNLFITAFFASLILFFMSINLLIMFFKICEALSPIIFWIPSHTLDNNF